MSKHALNLAQLTESVEHIVVLPLVTDVPNDGYKSLTDLSKERTSQDEVLNSYCCCTREKTLQLPFHF
jgi:hypothetical protein